ncbi:ABC transporter permease [Haloarcula pelagica]|uniref:ABC transporter permease n=1 Tax=Haloarcula pelagica TaxID=3033389 RepID=UPI0024C3654B|nr:ABC transporter permease subunit [Halomicroarcula sp. YJ-61-S]
MTRWLTVARKDIRGLIGSRTGKAGIAFVVLIFVFGGYIVPTTASDPTMTDYDGFIRGIALFLVPLFGLLLGYRAVVGERAAGRLTLTLSFPHSRADIVFGKMIGRGLVLFVTITVGVLGGAALIEYPFGSVALDRLVSYLGATLLFGFAFLAVGMALSTLTASLRRATVFTFGLFFLFVVGWPQLTGFFLQGLEYLNLASDELPNWAVFVHGAEPSMLYKRVLDTYVSPNKLTSGAALGSAGPWYLQGGPAAWLLVGWIILPSIGGYLQFRRTDL